jgi:hypothetical protein
MTNLNKLIKRRQGEVEKWKMFPEKEYIDIINYDQYQVEDVKNEVAEVATEAYRQALEDLQAGLYEVDVDKVPTIEQEAWANQYENKCEAFWYGESKGLSNVRAKIEELLGKID